MEAGQAEKVLLFLLGHGEKGPLLNLYHRADSARCQRTARVGEPEVLLPSRTVGQADAALLLQLFQPGVDGLLADPGLRAHPTQIGRAHV